MLNNEYNDSVPRNYTYTMDTNSRESSIKFIASSNLELNREYELGIQLLNVSGINARRWRIVWMKFFQVY